MHLRPIISTLVALGLFLPLAVCVLLGVESLLSAMGDAAGGAALRGVRLGLLVLWMVDLASLVVVLGIEQLRPPQPRQGPKTPPEE